MIESKNKIKYEEANIIDINNFTEADKQVLINRFEDVTVNGYHLLIFIYKPPIIRKNLAGIILPESTVEIDYEYRSCVGLVVKVGNEAYPEDKFTTPWCKVGDWVTFPRANGVQFRFDYALVINVPDDKILNVINDPSKIAR